MVKLIVFDIETNWDDEYSLKRMSTIQYILDPRFRIQSIGACVIETSSVPPAGTSWQTIVRRAMFRYSRNQMTNHYYEWDESEYVCLEEAKNALRVWLNQIGYEQADCVVAHNAAFDVTSIYYWLDLEPRHALCTMYMAQYLYGSADVGGRYTKYAGGSNSLEACFTSVTRGPLTIAPQKDRSALEVAKGRHLGSLNQQEYNEFLQYQNDDVHKCTRILEAWAEKVPDIRMYAIDWCVRLMRGSGIKFNHDYARRAFFFQKEAANANLAQFEGVTPAMLRSGPKFKAVMEQYVGEGNWPNVVSDKGNVIPLMSSNAPEWADILVDPNTPDHVKQLMKLKEEIGQLSRDKRIDRYCDISEDLMGDLPMHIIPSGAHTHRPTGGPGAGGNSLNMPKGGVIRTSIEAPDGHCLLVFDFTGIELRVCRWATRDQKTMDITLSGGDLYVETASSALATNREDITDKQRFVGKLTELSCQYGTGAKTLALATGVDKDTAQKFVDSFRLVEHPSVPRAWEACEYILSMWSTCTEDTYPREAVNAYMRNFLNIPADFGFRFVRWPSGTVMNYANMKQVTYVDDFGRHKMRYQYSKRHEDSMPKFIYGALFFENIIQSLSNEIMWERQEMIERELGVRIALQVYDELLLVVRDTRAVEIYGKVLEIMCRPIAWWPDGAPPLDADGSIVRRYSEAK